MEYEVKLQLDAEIDFYKILDFYSEINNALVAKFLKEYESRILSLSKSPYFQKKYGDVRSLKIGGFPFLLLFKIINKEVIVYAIFHTSQHPNKYP